MAKRKKQSIVISDVSNFHQIYNIKLILDKEYNGVMPLDIYNRFLKVISSQKFKTYFIRYFKPSTYANSKPVIHNINKHSTQSTCLQGFTPGANRNSDDQISEITKNTQHHYQSIFTVKANDFTFKSSNSGAHLVFQNHESIYWVKSEWFNPRVLNSINRTFQIKLCDYIGFTFIPSSDKDVFLTLIEEAFGNVTRQIYQENLNACFKFIEAYLNKCIDSYIYLYRNFKIETELKNYTFNESKQVFIYNFNVLSHLGINQSQVELHIPLSNIIKQLDKSDRKRFYSEIEAKYPDGFHTALNLDDLFPNRTSLDVSIKIPFIFIERLGKSSTIEVKAVYAPDLGRFNGGILTKIPGYPYKTTTSEVTFANCIKESLINIMRKIDNKFIITFYSAFIRMFNEGDSIAQSLYRKQTKKLDANCDIDLLPLIGSYRYKSGLSSLLPFDTSNTSDWIWLTSQMQNGVFIKAFTFKDKDETLSSKVGDTIKYPVKVYLTVRKSNYGFFYSQNELIKIETNVISMYALDESKSIYRFIVDKSKTYEAIFFIWSYFSSNNYNKRQDFDEVLILKNDFGILSFYKDGALENRSGIGYCDRKWLSDV